MAPLTERGDLILNPSQFVFIRDDKGSIRAYVGPQVKTISGNEQPVLFKEGEFIAAANQDVAVQSFVFVDQNDYVVLSNPSAADGKAHPDPGSASMTPELQYGRKEIITGPARFALWPGQTTRPINGHVLRSNEYLVALVRNGDEATANWDRAVLKPQATGNTPQTGDAGGEPVDPSQSPSAPLSATPPPPATPPQPAEPQKFSTGQRLVIKGTDFSFFIPPTGVEVMKDEEGKGGYVRKAVTLESLQYCVLLSESGDKRYMHGPDVIFPEPDETFIKADDGDENPRIFRAIELNEQMGIHVKVIADYTDETGPHRAGDELFITGATQRLYYPRAEHAVIPYRDKEQIHYSVIVPEGEGRYVLDKASGSIKTVKGPKMLLVNPITEVIMRRVLSEKEVRLWFPGNAEAAEINKALREQQGGSEFLSERAVGAAQRVVRTSSYMQGQALESFGGDTIERRKNFTLPKTVTIKTKYDGAVNINVWPGHAVQTVTRTGERRVVVGPASALLDYDQTLAIFELSAGTPKGSVSEKAKGVYLRITGNKVSDKIVFETSDLVGIMATVSYRVNFEGDDPNKWYQMDDYVGFLTDHLRSVLRGAMKQIGIEQFMTGQVDLIRDAILGKATDGGARPGKVFAENGMHVYDVEVLNVMIGDQAIASRLISAQRAAVTEMLTLQQKERELERTQRIEEINQALLDARTATTMHEIDIDAKEKTRRTEIVKAVEAANAELVDLRNKINEIARADSKASADQTLAIEAARQEMQLRIVTTMTDETVKRLAAIQPGLIEALQTMGKRNLLIEVASSMQPIPLGINESMTDALKRLFEGSVLASVIEGMNVDSK